MLQTLHRRNPSNESNESFSLLEPSDDTTAKTPDRTRSGTKKSMKTHNSDVDDDVESPLNRGRTKTVENGGSAPAPGSLQIGSSTLTSAGWKATISCLNYAFCSVSMILVNKSLTSSGLNILLVVFQAIVAVVCVEGFKHLGWIEQYPPLSWDVARSWAPVNLCFCAMLFTGMASLQYNSVPMVTVFKNITNIITTAGDFFFFGNKPEGLVVAAFGIMLFGAIAAAGNDLTISASGLFWMGANCVATAGYVLYMKFATVNVKLTKFGMVYVNNVLCVAFLLPAALMRGEVTKYLITDALHTTDYFLKNIFAGFVGFFLNYASLSCVQATGPTTYAIVGSLNKIPGVFLGYILFDDIITFDTWCYIGVSMFGGFLYSYAQIQKSRRRGDRSV